MSERLVAEEGPLKELILPFEEGEEWVLGRDPDASQLVLEDPAASRKHVLCKRTPNGILIENLSETNPVQVNEEELLSPRILTEGDTVRIGSNLFRFFINPTAEEPLSDERHESILGDENEPGTTSKHQFADINFDIAETGRWLLKVIGGPNNGAEFSMEPDSTYILGTDPNSCDIVFHDTSVSRQHARLSITADSIIFIEDLKSRNGSLVDGKPIYEKIELNPNTIVSIGTTSFVIYDREGNMQTIISPLLPSIVKVLQKDEKSEKPAESTSEIGQETSSEIAPATPPPARSLGALILIAIITGLFVLVAIGTTTLFKSEPIVPAEALNEQVLPTLLADYPSLKYSFNKNQGSMVLWGHLLTAQDKTQLLYSLQAIPAIKSIDDTGVIIDEYVWQEMNQVLNKNPNWRTVSIQSPAAGQFILTGSLQSRKEADRLYEYVTINFPYLDHLERNVVVEEDIVNDATSQLASIGIVNLQVSYRNGELLISGSVPNNKQQDLASLVDEFKKIRGIRNVRTQINMIAPEQAMQNISDRYEVTGFSRLGTKISVVINGRIVTSGDVLDGMKILRIEPGTVLLEKGEVKYRIDFSK